MAYTRTTYVDASTVVNAAALNGPEAHLAALADVGVSAYRSGSTQAITKASDQTVIFNSEYSDIGSDYDTTTGEFTAPTAGWYLVGVNLAITQLSTAGVWEVSVFKNGSYAQGLGAFPAVSAGSPTNMGGVTMIQLAAADVIKIVVREDTANDWRVDYISANSRAASTLAIARLS
jgi:hypothetical protein